MSILNRIWWFSSLTKLKPYLVMRRTPFPAVEHVGLACVEGVAGSAGIKDKTSETQSYLDQTFRLY